LLGTTAISDASVAVRFPTIRPRDLAADRADVEFREFSREICEPNTAKRNNDSTLALALALLFSGAS